MLMKGMNVTQQYTRRSANKAARDRLIDEHRARYRELQREEYEKVGLELPMTELEKAEATATELFNKHPELRTKLLADAETSAPVAAEGTPPPVGNEGVRDDGELPEGHNIFDS